jgi:hypothetical protein
MEEVGSGIVCLTDVTSKLKVPAKWMKGRQDRLDSLVTATGAKKRKG